MKKLMDPYQFKVWVAVLMLAVTIIVVSHVVAEFSVIAGWIGAFFAIIAPFIWGFMISYVLNLPRERFEAWLDKAKYPLIAKWKRGLSVAITYLVLIVVVFLVLNLILPQIYESIADFVDVLLPELIATVNEFLLNLDQNEAIPFVDMSAVADSFTIDAVLDFVNPDNVAAVISTIVGFTGVVFRLALALISSVYFLIEAERIKLFTARLLKATMPARLYPSFMKYGREINTYFKRYIKCQVLDAVILGTIMTVAMSVMGIGYAFVLGPMLGFANLIPYFGSIVGTAAAVLVIMLTDGANVGFIAAIVLVVIQQFDANFIFPRLLGGSMKIPPLLVIIGIAVGGAFYGILGMIVAIPIVTVLRNIVIDILTHVELKKMQRSREAGADEKRI